MADTYVTNSGFTPVDPTREMMLQAQNYTARQDMIGDAGFNKVLGGIQGAMSLAGPVLGAASPFMGNKGAMITSAAVGGFMGQNGALQTPGLMQPSAGPFSKGLAMPGAAPGFQAGGAGGMPGGAPGFPGAPGAGPQMGSSTSQFDSQINAMQTQQVEMLGLQARVQNISQVGQMMSNIAKTDSDAKLNAIRNIRS